MTKILVTGASGFIGLHVLKTLSTLNVEVTACYRQKKIIPNNYTNIQYIKFDLKDSSDKSFELLGSPDILIHLAWNGLPNYKSDHHIDEELPTQLKFLNDMVKSGLKNLFVAGTCFEYGMQDGELTETQEALPDNKYGLAKVNLYNQLKELKNKYPFNLTWGRLFYLYGKGQAENSLIPQLERSIANHDASFNMSGGEQIRDFIDVTKASEFIVRLALAQKDIGLINICSGTPIKVKNFVEHWLKEHQKKIRLNLGFYPYPDYEAMEFWGDNKKLLSTLKNAPELL